MADETTRLTEQLKVAENRLQGRREQDGGLLELGLNKAGVPSSTAYPKYPFQVNG